jgi:hypothetical protein
MGLSELGHLARRAFEEKRRKNCVALTNAMLKIDPNNREALVIQSWINSDLGNDVDRARKLLGEARARNSLASYDRVEVVLHGILNVDPENEQAKAMLQEVMAAARAIPPFEPLNPDRITPPMEPLPDDSSITSKVRKLAVPAVLVTLVGLAVVAGIFGIGSDQALSGAGSLGDAGFLSIAMDDGVQVFVNDEYKGTTPLESLNLEPGSYVLRYELDGQNIGEEQVRVGVGATSRNTITSTAGSLNLIVVPKTGVLMSLDQAPVQPVPPLLELKAGDHHMRFTAEGYLSESVTATVKAGERRNFVVTLQPSGAVRQAPSGPQSPARVSETAATRQTAATSTPSGAAAAGASADTTAASVPPAPLENGTLALSAAVPVEIYEGNTYLGATPTTLRLPEGTHNLEYRYRDLRKSQSHVVRANQTTTATVGFDVTVQINARPFAEIFFDGLQMRPLGETPLSNVRVPVGGVLVFRHPNFPEKRYRVTGTETTIQVVFP